MTLVLSLEPTAQCNRSERNQKGKTNQIQILLCTISFLNLECLQGETVLRNRPYTISAFGVKSINTPQVTKINSVSFCEKICGPLEKPQGEISCMYI